jgi:hypothetical protein
MSVALARQASKQGSRVGHTLLINATLALLLGMTIIKASALLLPADKEKIIGSS